MGSQLFMTPEVKIAFPYLFTLDDRGKYSVNFLFPKDDAWKTWVHEVLEPRRQEAVAEAMAGIWGGVAPANTNLPIHDSLQPTKSGKIPATDYGYGDAWYFAAKSGNLPGVWNSDHSPISDPKVIYGGCVCNGEINIYAYNHRDGGKGLAFGLSCVVLQKLGERTAQGPHARPQLVAKKAPVYIPQPGAVPQGPPPQQQAAAATPTPPEPDNAYSPAQAQQPDVPAWM